MYWRYTTCLQYKGRLAYVTCLGGRYIVIELFPVSRLVLHYLLRQTLNK